MPEFVVPYNMTIYGSVVIDAKSKGSARNEVLKALNKFAPSEIDPFKSSREASCHSAISIPLSGINEV
jgi:hypothetical protein